MTVQSGLLNHASLDRCKTVVVVAPSGGYTQGELTMVENTVGVICTEVDIDDNVAMIYESPSITVPCEAAATGGFAVGDKVYYNGAGAVAAATGSGHYLCGSVQEAASLGDVLLKISLDGRMGIVA